jgi:hypothetical protein
LLITEHYFFSVINERTAEWRNNREIREKKEADKKQMREVRD